MRTRIPGWFALVVLGLAASPAVAQDDRADVGKQLRALTGSHTRVVWVQDTGDGVDIFARGRNLRLLGLDSDDGRGEREIVPGIGGFHKPFFTPSGGQIIFSNFATVTAYVVNWDGTGLKELTHGIAAAAWIDPATRIEWVYVQAGNEGPTTFRYNPIRRFRIDNPAVSEVVWDKTPTNPEGFQVSPDGKRAVSLFPWPHFGVAGLPNVSFTELGQGCCASLSHEAGDKAFHLLGDHRNLMMYSLVGDDKWKVPVSQAPGVDGFEIYHPKWSNQSRFLVLCGPFRGSGGLTVEVYLGRFNPALTAVEDWVRVTNNNKGDFYPDAWVDPGAAKVARFTLNGTPVMTPQPAH